MYKLFKFDFSGNPEDKDSTLIILAVLLPCLFAMSIILFAYIRRKQLCSFFKREGIFNTQSNKISYKHDKICIYFEGMTSILMFHYYVGFFLDNCKLGQHDSSSVKFTCSDYEKKKDKIMHKYYVVILKIKKK